MSHFGYLGVFLALFLEAVGIPFPAETILVTSGIEMTRGIFAFLPLWLFGTLGNILGSQVAYGVGRYLGRPVILKYGRYVGIKADRLESVEVRFQKYQIPFLVIGKFIAFVRIVIPYLAGINRITYWKFNVLNTLSAAAWSCLFIVIGNSLDQIWKHDRHFLLSHLYITIPVVAVIVAAILWFHHRSKRALPKPTESASTSTLGN